MKGLVVGLLLIFVVGCGPKLSELIDSIPNNEFDLFQYARNTGPSSATIVAKNVVKDDSGLLIEQVEILENFTFGSFHLRVKGLYLETPAERSPDSQLDMGMVFKLREESKPVK